MKVVSILPFLLIAACGQKSDSELNAPVPKNLTTIEKSNPKTFSKDTESLIGYWAEPNVEKGGNLKDECASVDLRIRLNDEKSMQIGLDRTRVEYFSLQTLDASGDVSADDYKQETALTSKNVSWEGKLYRKTVVTENGLTFAFYVDGKISGHTLESPDKADMGYVLNYAMTKDGQLVCKAFELKDIRNIDKDNFAKAAAEAMRGTEESRVVFKRSSKDPNQGIVTI